MAIVSGINPQDVLMTQMFEGAAHRNHPIPHASKFYRRITDANHNGIDLSSVYNRKHTLSLVLKTRRARNRGALVTPEVASLLSKTGIKLIPTTNLYSARELGFFTIFGISKQILDANSEVRPTQELTVIGPHRDEFIYDSDYYIAVGTEVVVSSYEADEDVSLPEIPERVQEVLGSINNSHTRNLLTSHPVFPDLV